MNEVTTLPTAERGRLARLLNLRAAGDALATYYALQHPADKVRLFSYEPEGEAPRGFLVLAQTGFDLFRPLAVPFVASERGMRSLLRSALEPGRPVLLTMPLGQRLWVEAILELSEVTLLSLLRVDAAVYEPILNVFLVEASSPDGAPRYEIRGHGESLAAAGLNWRGDRFAEVYVQRDGAANSAHIASVLSAIVGWLMKAGRIALLRLEDGDQASHAAAEQVGFRLTGERTLMCQAIRPTPESTAANSR